MEDRIKDIMSQIFGGDKDKVTPETHFVNDLGADSLDTVELVMELEEEFDITITDDNMAKIATFGDLLAFITKSQENDHGEG